MAQSGKDKRHEAGIMAGIVVFTFLLAFAISQTKPFRFIELKITDKLFELRGPQDISSSPVVLVAISQQADDEIPYKYPWPTSLYARLIENLNKAGAKAIGIDIVFDNPDRYNPRNDTLFASVLRKYGNVVLAGNLLREERSRGGGSQSSLITPVEPTGILQEANPNPYGLISKFEDEDDFIRRYLLAVNYQSQRYLSFGLEVLKIYCDVKDSDVQQTNGYFRVGPYTISTFNGPTMLINFFGPPGTFPEYSFENVIDDSTFQTNSEDEEFQFNTFDDPEYRKVFKGKIVLVGATMGELHDFHSTPFSNPEDGVGMPGYETHANAIQTILSSNYIYHAGVMLNLLFILCFSVFAVFITKYAGAVWSFVWFVLEAGMIFAMVAIAFVYFSYLIDLTGPVLAVLAGYVTTLSYDYIKERKEKRRIRNLFSSYVSPVVVEEIISTGQEPQLGGDEVFMTAFFSDIESFSGISEQLTPRRLVDLMDEYLTAMTDIITSEGGTLDKYIGDAIVAFFGAPLPRANHAYKACLVSQLMQQKLRELRRKWQVEGNIWPEAVHHMRNRIGINTGLMVTGNMGSARRFNYTVMGDNVNLAARCESGARTFGVYTMVTDDTRQEAQKYGDECIFRYLDRIVVKGRTHPVDVYEIIGLRGEVSERVIECKQLFEEGIGAYKLREWGKAMRLFEQAERLEPNRPESDPSIKTNPSKVYLERCNVMLHHPPPDDWNGVYVMETK